MLLEQYDLFDPGEDIADGPHQAMPRALKNSSFSRCKASSVARGFERSPHLGQRVCQFLGQLREFGFLFVRRRHGGPIDRSIYVRIRLIDRCMPAWSTEIANEFVHLADAEWRAFDQSQLQKLVYIAHGWCLALYDQPLTGDRPEAWEFGPVYRRLAHALARYGQDPIEHGIDLAEIPHKQGPAEGRPIASDLDQKERELITAVFDNYGKLSASQLSNWTRRGSAPWKDIFAGKAGEYRDIPHSRVRVQFVEILKEADRSTTRPSTLRP